MVVNLFFETYECKIDDKARLKLPVSLVRKLRAEEGGVLVVKRSVFENCLEVYPPEPWMRMMKKINGLNRFVKKNADFIRLFTAGVKEVEIDKADRILLPKDLKQFAGLDKEIVINGVGDYFEIWDKGTYEAGLSADSEGFAKLAESVMGGVNDLNTDDGE